MGNIDAVKKYQAKRDSIMLRPSKEDGKIILSEKIKGHIINTTEGHKKVYSLGAFDWTWEDHTIDELKEFIESIGEKGFRAKQVYGWIHKKLVPSFDDMANVPKELREKFKKV